MTRYSWAMVLVISVCGAFWGPVAGLGQTGPVGPTPYLSFDCTAPPTGCTTEDSPFKALSFRYFYLETFEDHLLNVPGVSASAGDVTSVIFGSFFDSVDADDGVIDGSGSGGDSYFGSGDPGISFTFDAGVLGTLPTHVGIVWTDGDGTTTFSAFGPGNVLLGTIGPVALADGSSTGTTGEDHFFGWIDAGGIERIQISNSSGGIEVDHLQFGQSGAVTPITAVSQGVGGAPTDGASEAPMVSADGRYVVFASRATNLVVGGSPAGVTQVYRFDRTTGLMARVSETPGGVPGDGASGDPVVSTDGRYVVYPTLAQNLALDCANGIRQIVRTDMVTKQTVCVSQGSGGAGTAASRQPTMSEDGTLVAFVTPAPDLDPACGNGVDQVQLRDLTAGTTRCVSVDAAGQAGTGPSVEPRLSGDGTRLVYATRATNLLFPAGVAAARGPGVRAVDGAPLAQAEPLAQIVRQSTAVGAAVTELLSRGPGGALGNGESRRPAVSDDGQTVAFESTATNLSSECATGVAQVLVTGAGGMRCASRNEDGAPGDAPSTAPAISGTGAVVVWVSLARNLTRSVTGPPDVSQILRTSLTTHNAVVELLSQAGGTAGNGASQRPALDRAGQFTVFQTAATNLASGDTNGQVDVLLVVILLAPPGTLDRVVITAPANGSVLPLTGPTPVTVMWTPMSGATQYALEFTGADRVFANPNGTGPDGVNGFGGAGGAVIVPTTSFGTTLGPGFPAGLYQVRVLGLTAAFQLVGRFSDAVTLALGAVPPGNGRVRITQPGPGSVLTRGTPVTFVWDALPAVASYFFEFTGPAGQFANPNGTGPDPGNTGGGGLIVSNTGFMTTVPPLTPGVYQVRVIGRTASGAFVGTFSDAVTLTIQ